MNERPTTSALAPEVRAGLAVMARQDAEERARIEAETAERRRQDIERRERDAAAMRQTIEAFRTR